jgi:hypothetical protein
VRHEGAEAEASGEREDGDAATAVPADGRATAAGGERLGGERLGGARPGAGAARRR